MSSPNEVQLGNAAALLILNHVMVNVINKVAGNEISNTIDSVSIQDALIYRLAATKAGDMLRLKLGAKHG